ncbi:MAG: SDR family NAD(P)-dependent oxidoreductase [Propionibacteriaceae bacterium]|jgi:NADP-dependent 3-hydroxy acid dehydrogenase YdfG|nr:SDR family NAD(P)-dependent oxidoreductase [Propionibacteriaceae bacterium]
MQNLPIAVVTGAGGGVGQETVRVLATDHQVIALARATDSLSALAAIPNVAAVHLDLLDPSEIAAVGATLVAGHPKIKVLAHTAGLTSPATLSGADAEVWRQVMGTNAIGPALLTRALLPALRAAGADVVFINSGAGKRALARNITYNSAKHALTGFTNSLRLAEPGLRVVSIFPGQIDTQMLRSSYAALQLKYDPSAYIRPASVAAAIRWVVDSGADVQITNIDLRPRRETAAAFNV